MNCHWLKLYAYKAKNENSFHFWMSINRGRKYGAFQLIWCSFRRDFALNLISSQKFGGNWCIWMVFGVQSMISNALFHLIGCLCLSIIHAPKMVCSISDLTSIYHKYNPVRLFSSYSLNLAQSFNVHTHCKFHKFVLMRLNKAVNLAAGSVFTKASKQLKAFSSGEHLLSMNASYYLTKVICAAQTNIGKHDFAHVPSSQ